MTNKTIRLATLEDIPRLKALIALSGIELSKGFYTDQQARSVTDEVYGVDTQLIHDQTYYLIEIDDQIAACGGWSQRATLCGSDQTKQGEDKKINPETDAARIRAFFVAPEFARQGLASQMLEHCVNAAKQAGFKQVELVATMPGEPFYLQKGYFLDYRYALHLSNGVKVPVARMIKDI